MGEARPSAVGPEQMDLCSPMSGRQRSGRQMGQDSDGERNGCCGKGLPARGESCTREEIDGGSETQGYRRLDHRPCQRRRGYNPPGGGELGEGLEHERTALASRYCQLLSRHAATGHTCVTNPIRSLPTSALQVVQPGENTSSLPSLCVGSLDR